MAPLIEIRRIAGWVSTLLANNRHDSATTAKRQLMGVQRPISMRNPAAIPMPAVAMAAARGSGKDLATPCASNKVPARDAQNQQAATWPAVRKDGEEPLHRKMNCRARLCPKTGRENTHKSVTFPTRFGYLQIHDSALDGDGYGVCRSFASSFDKMFLSRIVSSVRPPCCRPSHSSSFVPSME